MEKKMIVCTGCDATTLVGVDSPYEYPSFEFECPECKTSISIDEGIHPQAEEKVGRFFKGLKRLFLQR